MKFKLEQLAADAKELEWEIACKFGKVQELDARQCLQLQNIDMLKVIKLADEKEAGFMATQKYWCVLLQEICKQDAIALKAIDAVLKNHQSDNYDESLGKLVQWDTQEIEAARQNLQTRIASLKPMINDKLSDEIKQKAEIAILYSEALLALCNQKSNAEIAENVAKIKDLAQNISYIEALQQTAAAWAESV